MERYIVIALAVVVVLFLFFGLSRSTNSTEQTTVVGKRKAIPNSYPRGNKSFKCSRCETRWKSSEYKISKGSYTSGLWIVPGWIISSKCPSCGTVNDIGIQDKSQEPMYDP